MTGSGPKTAQLLYQQTVDETTSYAVDCRGYRDITMYLIGSGVTSSGVLTYEEAMYDPTIFNGTGGFAGTWSSVGTVNASDVDGDKQKATHFTSGAYGWVRARISTAIGGGGNITVILVANPA